MPARVALLTVSKARMKDTLHCETFAREKAVHADNFWGGLVFPQHTVEVL